MPLVIEPMDVGLNPTESFSCVVICKISPATGLRHAGPYPIEIRGPEAYMRKKCYDSPLRCSTWRLIAQQGRLAGFLSPHKK